MIDILLMITALIPQIPQLISKLHSIFSFLFFFVILILLIPILSKPSLSLHEPLHACPTGKDPLKIGLFLRLLSILGPQFPHLSWHRVFLTQE